MSTRFKMSDTRWFADRRPTCIVENEYKRRLNVIDDFQYSATLQQKGLELFNEKVRKEPKITVEEKVNQFINQR